MKKLIALALALVMALTTLCVLAETEEPFTLVMATNAQFPPYEFYDGEEVVGIDVEIAKAIAAYNGWGFDLIDMEFDYIINEVLAGTATCGLAGMTVTEERKMQVAFSDSYAKGVQVVIVKEDSPIASVDDLFAGEKKYSIGVQLSTTGDLYCTWDLEDMGLATVNRYMSGAEAVLALTTGKVDCVVIDNEPAKAFVAANEGLKILETEYAVENYAACFHPDNTEILAKFNEALAALTADGTIPAIIEKYIPSAEKAE